MLLAFVGVCYSADVWMCVGVGAGVGVGAMLYPMKQG